MKNKNIKNYLNQALIILGLFLIDQFTKYLISSKFILGESKIIINGFFNLTYVRNTGAGFSILEGHMAFFYLITVVALGLMFYLLKDAQKESKLTRFAILLMIGGTLGNFFDRLINHYVIDFLDFVILGWDFPVFNFADICLTVGVFLFVIDMLFIQKKEGHSNA